MFAAMFMMNSVDPVYAGSDAKSSALFNLSFKAPSSILVPLPSSSHSWERPLDDRRAGDATGEDPTEARVVQDLAPALAVFRQPAPLPFTFQHH